MKKRLIRMGEKRKKYSNLEAVLGLCVVETKLFSKSQICTVRKAESSGLASQHVELACWDPSVPGIPPLPLPGRQHGLASAVIVGTGGIKSNLRSLLGMHKRGTSEFWAHLGHG